MRIHRLKGFEESKGAQLQGQVMRVVRAPLHKENHVSLYIVLDFFVYNLHT